MEKRTYTVAELNGAIKSMFDMSPGLIEICVRGELSNYKMYPSGHHYFTLKDSQSSIRCVMFKGNASKLRWKPEDGASVAAFGSVTVYVRDGAYQLYCTDLRPEGTGDLQVAFEQLKARLDAEGLFSPEHKKPLPRFPERIALVTSSAGAAVRDIIRVLGKRWPMSRVIVAPVRVQGQEAPPEIVGALRYINAHKLADLIITGRGGGSIEDLWAFNDERVARAIFESVIPVISAVGHEPDTTISDYVADRRAATPSNAAEIAVPDSEEVGKAIESHAIRLGTALERRITEQRSTLSALSSRRVITDPSAYTDEKRMSLDFMRERFISVFERSVASKRQVFVKAGASLGAMSPLEVLGRGYSIASREDGGLILTVDEVEIGERIHVTLKQGSLLCRLEEKSLGGRDGD